MCRDSILNGAEIAKADETISCRVDNHYGGFIREMSGCVLFLFDTCVVVKHGYLPSKQIATRQVKMPTWVGSIADRVGISSVSKSFV